MSSDPTISFKNLRLVLGKLTPLGLRIKNFLSSYKSKQTNFKKFETWFSGPNILCLTGKHIYIISVPVLAVGSSRESGAMIVTVENENELTSELLIKKTEEQGMIEAKKNYQKYGR